MDIRDVVTLWTRGRRSFTNTSRYCVTQPLVRRWVKTSDVINPVDLYNPSPLECETALTTSRWKNSRNHLSVTFFAVTKNRRRGART